MRAVAMVKSILLSLLGLMVIWFLAVTLPLWIVGSDFEPFPFVLGGLRFVGWVPIVVGAIAFLWCYGAFIFIGKGTPWPFDPPRELVVAGLYRFVRNPMEASFLLVVLGEVLLFESSALALYAVSGFIWLSLRQVVIEEPGLRRRFGQRYEDYRRSVPRWIPRWTPYRPEGG
jgi:protein-S-isoprenylcysteine O-methyltransferase Ste14